jgi:hypothetical protein
MLLLSVDLMSVGFDVRRRIFKVSVGVETRQTKILAADGTRIKHG